MTRSYTTASTQNSPRTWRYTAVGGETTLSGVDGFSTTLSYAVGGEQLFVNGVLLERGVDYTATNGTSVTLSNALVLGDLVTINSQNTFAIANAIPLSTVTAAGDLIVASGAGAVTPLHVGANGSTLVANSAVGGMSWVSPISGGKNAFINGSFDIWQRGTSFTNPAGVYTVDRWSNWGDGSRSVTQVDAISTGLQVPNIKYVMRYASTSTSGQTGFDFGHSIEDVQTFAGQTVTLSFYAKAGTTVSNAILYGGYNQSFGTGGSTTVGPFDIGFSANPPTLTTSWQRLSYTFTLPSIIGKTIGSGSNLNFYFGLARNQNTNFDFAGFQLELGPVATAFTRAGGTLAGELAACQRYYWRVSAAGGYAAMTNYFNANATNQVYAVITTPVVMRTPNSVVDWGGNICLSDSYTAYTNISSISSSGGQGNQQTVNLSMSSSVLTQYRGYRISDNGAGTAYFGLGCEF